MIVIILIPNSEVHDICLLLWETVTLMTMMTTVLVKLLSWYGAPVWSVCLALFI